MRLIIGLVVIGVVLAAPPSGSPCPKDCTCDEDINNNNWKLQCRTFDFMNKLYSKQYATITNLTLNNRAVEKVDPKLKYLKNIQYLDLSGCNVALHTLPQLPSLKHLKISNINLKSVNLSNLPSNLEELDLSNNYLAYLPKDWSHLPKLNTLHLQGNPLDCDCNNVIIYDTIVQHGVKVPNPPTCNLPKKYEGKPISHVNCSSLADVMLYDSPEGSGSLPPSQEQENLSIIEEEINEDEFIPSDPTSTQFPITEETLEGSGSEGSGDELIIPDIPKACLINCSTPKSVGSDDEPFASASPKLVDQLNIIYEDLFINKSDIITTTITPETTVTPEPPLPIFPEETIIKESEPTLQHSDKDDVEQLHESEGIGELEKVSLAPDNKNTIYTIAGVCTVIMIIILILLLKKRKANQEATQPLSQYSPDLKSNINNKPLLVPYDEPKKPLEESPENTPLLNGKLSSEPEDVEIRPHNDDYREPQRQRVTVIETELPDSIPKSPIMVQRKKNSVGEIVTTVLPMPSS